MIKIGLIVNPNAGMGGNVGLKGTDGEMYKKAIELGATPVAPGRINEVLSLVKRRDIIFICAQDKMGEEYLKNLDFKYEVIGESKKQTTSKDTKKSIRLMIDKGAELIVFVGGDGTARDVLDVVGLEVPVIAIPSGVKMFSSVFAFSPHAAAKMIDSFDKKFIEKEVLDIDEDAFSENRLVAKLYGYVKVPEIENLLQGKKAASDVSVYTKEKKTDAA